MTAQDSMRMAIACGGTGGHLFPGLAVAEHLRARGCRVTLLISPKDVDQQGVQGVSGMEILTLPAVALNRGGEFAFLRGFIRSYRNARRAFRPDPPAGALAMGGFTSAPPVLAARRLGAVAAGHCGALRVGAIDHRQGANPAVCRGRASRAWNCR